MDILYNILISLKNLDIITVAVPLTAQRTKPTFQNLVRIRVIDLKKRDFYPFSASYGTKINRTSASEISQI